MLESVAVKVPKNDSRIVVFVMMVVILTFVIDIFH